MLGSRLLFPMQSEVLSQIEGPLLFAWSLGCHLIAGLFTLSWLLQWSEHVKHTGHRMSRCAMKCFLLDSCSFVGSRPVPSPAPCELFSGNTLQRYTRSWTYLREISRVTAECMDKWMKSDRSVFNQFFIQPSFLGKNSSLKKDQLGVFTREEAEKLITHGVTYELRNISKLPDLFKRL